MKQSSKDASPRAVHSQRQPEPGAILGGAGALDTQRDQHTDLGWASPPAGLLLETPGERAGSKQLFTSTRQRAPSGAAQSQAASLRSHRRDGGTHPLCPKHRLLSTSSSLAAKSTHGWVFLGFPRHKDAEAQSAAGQQCCRLPARHEPDVCRAMRTEACKHLPSPLRVLDNSYKTSSYKYTRRKKHYK